MIEKGLVQFEDKGIKAISKSIMINTILTEMSMNCDDNIDKINKKHNSI